MKIGIQSVGVLLAGVLSMLAVTPVTALETNPSGAVATENDHSLLSDLIAEALANNPELQSAKARWEMYEHRVIPSRSLDDPRLSFALSNYPIDSFADDETPMTGKEIQLSQMFPFPGKLAAKGEMAEQQALWYRGVYDDARLRLVQQVKDAWYQLYFKEQAIDITHKNITLLKDFVRLTETRYAVGTGLQQDVLKAQVERSKLQDKLFSLEQQRISALSDLNRLLGRAIDATLSLPDDLSLTEIDAEINRLSDLSRTHRPLFAAYEAMIDRYKAQRKLAKLNYYPDFNVFAGYRVREEVPGDPAAGSDFISAGVSINLPLWQAKRRAEVAEADSALRMAWSQLADMRNGVDSTIIDQVARMKKDRDLVTLYRTGVIPQAQQSFEASLAAYQVGDTDFLNLLDGLMTLYRYQIDYQRALSDHERSVARLEAAVGVTFASQE
ncbi:metal ion efflux pump, RND family, outer membrane protein [Syntrophotalea carbinolica DSM 2380]|uniref:Metal ion efflux pump, RND family, outer membrane protein n=1 Tax=Syntrophotalea carbinolica (strain DSM 2380 / NBRC 103641 / GraBd1) TaxID=338963 RepID=Q3A3U8_SYNC1|nr:TolC family protein [Syntrophotalea carbinolica]ABA88959.2 metal ion efflux pump, RND family, outer membrane protein [Syntrophotalea carbinolica DSM 2380]